MSFFERMIEKFEIVGRARTLSVLRQQSDRTLEDAGFSPELVRVGIKAWPWRAEDHHLNQPYVRPEAAAPLAMRPQIKHSVAANVGRVAVSESIGAAANKDFDTAA